jgi:hypothetical protein
MSISLIILTSGCSTFTSNLKREFLKDEEIMPGNYTLILHGAKHGEDLETIAMLDFEGDEFTFELHASEYKYETKKHMGDGEALEEAESFISWYPSFSRAQVSRITDEQGRILGYEVRPFYLRISTYGFSDVLNVYYELEDKKVTILIRLKRDVEKAIEGDGRDRLMRRRSR